MLDTRHVSVPEIYTSIPCARSRFRSGGRDGEAKRPREMQGPLGVPGREGRGPEEVGEVDIQVQI